MFSWVFTLALLIASCIPSAAANPIIEQAHKTTHKIVLGSYLGHGGSCSATAIGPHALLTASHCNAVSPTVDVDGKTVSIVSIIGDSMDHSIYLLGDELEFKDYASVKLDNVQNQGDSVFLFGNPSDFTDMFRKGYVSGFEYKKSEPSLFGLLLGMKPAQSNVHTAVLYDFNGFFGDSGSGIFDENGQVIAVTSFITGDQYLGYSMKFMGSIPFHLTQDQLDQARKFRPTVKGKEWHPASHYKTH